jgi:heme exporter protein A
VVFSGVSLSIDAGRIYVLRGANGAGKTTLLRTLAGFAPPAAGTLDRSDDATVFLGHSDGVKAALSARENISFWRSLYGAHDAASDRAMAMLRVAPFLHQRASTLSAGQKRRLSLCRIAMSGRPVWVLDEPTAGMDAASVAAVINLVGAHCAGGGAAIVATHERLDFANAVAVTLAATA